MYLKASFICITLLGSLSLTVQAQHTTPFENFAAEQNKQFVDAYKKLDTVQYHQLLQTFLTKYHALAPDQQKDFSGDYVNAFYNLACTYALLKEKSQTLYYLEKAIQGGYADYTHLLSDTDLDIVRKEKKFVQLIDPLRAVGDYLYILKKAGQYDWQQKRDIPTFTYQNANNANLVALRKAFNLDSIVGKGNDISQVLHLLHWVHNLVPHDGNNGNPVVKNAMSMIAVCKQGNRGLNCRGLAIVLNECYLAMGLPSRMVTCYPKDSLKTDPDCHVINAVYLNSLKKWVWVDPTNDAYVMDEKGALLSIEEVRHRIVNDQPLILNPEANWNRQVSKTKETYLYGYMAKNLYMLECPINSEYDVETFGNDKKITYVKLLPLDYHNQKPIKTEYNNTEIKTTFFNYLTNNPSWFWQAPQQ